MIRPYARFVSKNPIIMLVIVVLITIAAVNLSSNVGTKSMDNDDTLPDDIDVIRAFDILSDNFGGSDSIMIAVEIEPSYRDSNEIRDVRDPEIIKYTYLLAESARGADDVISASSSGTLLRSANSGVLPKTKRRIVELSGSYDLSSYVSPDYSMTIVSVRLSDSYDEKDIVDDMQQVIDIVPRPSGLKVRVAGDVATGPVVEASIDPDMQRTSNFSLIGILIVLLLLFLSVRYALTPLAVIGVGIIWAFGFFGLMGINLSPATSGAISMIMGIGIDFGIQTVMRFRHELKSLKPEKAMENTLIAVMKPMATTTLAALIGFQAMSMGDLTIMQELGTIMSYGVLFCFLAAITLVPSVSILGERASKFLTYKKILRLFTGGKLK